MNSIVAFSKVLSDETRWRIVRLIRQEALCVCELADILEMPQSSVSSHVQVIRKAGLLESEKREKWTYFRINAPYLKLIALLEAFFKDEVTDQSLEEDEMKMNKRLEERAGSCCPGPIQLKSRRSRQTNGSTKR